MMDLPVKRTEEKKVVLMSDDWGSVRIQSKSDQKALVQKGLSIRNRFDRFDSLEMNQDLELLFEILTKHKDKNGNHPVITAVTNVANPDFTFIRESGFEEYRYETIDKTYSRYSDSSDVLRLTKEGIKQGIFIPQSHGREHVQVNWWMDELQNPQSRAREYFKEEFFFLSGSELIKKRRGRGIGAAFDVWDQKDIETHKEVVKSGLEIFEQLYGYRSTSFTPPAMFYHPEIEKTIKECGTDWIDVGRLFKTPKVGGGERWQMNYLGKERRSGLQVLVRNAMFEPNIDPNDDGVDRCLKDIKNAFKAKQPVIISNHRAAFAGRIDPKNREKGLKALDKLIRQILKKWPDVEFTTVKKMGIEL